MLRAVSVPAYPVEAVDALGAGDCYAGVLLAELCHGGGIDEVDIRAVREAMQRAAAAAAIAASREGVMSSFPSRGEVDRFVAARL